MYLLSIKATTADYSSCRVRTHTHTHTHTHSTDSTEDCLQQVSGSWSCSKHAKYYRWPAHGSGGTALDPETSWCQSSCSTRVCPHHWLPALYETYPSPRQVISVMSLLFVFTFLHVHPPKNTLYGATREYIFNTCYNSPACQCTEKHLR